MIGILKHFFLIRKIRELIKDSKPIFIFVPTIAKCEDLFAFLSKWIRKGNYVHSKRKNREKVINDFRQSKYNYLVTTAVLERGVTLKNLQVIVFECDHAIYTTSALVQIAGRVGRKKDAPQGEVVFLSDRRTAAMDEAIREIKAKNKSLSPMPL
jgi:competence protein ComFA